MAHTMGPWHVGDNTSENGEEKAVFDGLGWLVADTETGMRSDIEEETNARLIAAAPDLLSIARRWAAIDGSAWHVQRYADEKARLLNDTLLAIDKAEGR